MAFKPAKRKFAFSDGTLSELGDTLVLFGERDLTEMNEYGYDQARLDEIKLKIAAFKEFSSDEYYSGIMMEATADKNAAIKKMSEAAESIVMRGIIKWGKDSYRIRAFQWAGYISKSDANKTAACRVVHKVGTINQAELASAGVTVALLDELKTKITNADEAMVMKQVRVGERDAKVNERITAGNELYDELVKLADTGKHIHEDTNEARYNDYVIYTSEPDIQTVTGTVAVSTIHQPSVVINSKKDVIKIIVTTPKASLIAYLAEDPTDEPLEDQKVFTATASEPLVLNAQELNWSKTACRLLLKNSNTAIEAEFTVTVKG